MSVFLSADQNPITFPASKLKGLAIFTHHTNNRWRILVYQNLHLKEKGSWICLLESFDANVLLTILYKCETTVYILEKTVSAQIISFDIVVSYTEY